MRRLLAASLIACAGAAAAAPDILSFGDPARGKALYQEKCAACHASQFGGDGSGIFTAARRRIHTPAALLAQVHRCNQSTGAGLTAEDEQCIAAWLNQRDYSLK